MDIIDWFKSLFSSKTKKEIHIDWTTGKDYSAVRRVNPETTELEYISMLPKSVSKPSAPRSVRPNLNNYTRRSEDSKGSDSSSDMLLMATLMNNSAYDNYDSRSHNDSCRSYENNSSSDNSSYDNGSCSSSDSSSSSD